MSKPVQLIRATDLVEADPTPGMLRRRAFEVPTLWAGHVETMPGAVSGWHHHDLNETSVYVVSGVLRFEFDGYDGYIDAEAVTSSRYLPSPCTVRAIPPVSPPWR